MNAKLLLEHFDRLAEAPDVIPRLRQFILDLAVRGKLVEQDPKDEPAEESLARIRKEKLRSGTVAEPKLGRKGGPRAEDELGFALPARWQITSLSHVLAELQTGPFGSSLHQSDYQRGGVPVINPASIQGGQLVPIERMAVGPKTLERLATFKLRAGDVVMGRRGEMGRCAVVREREDGWLCGTGSLILRLASGVYPRFLVTLIGSPYVRQYLGGAAVGATMQNLNQSILLSFAFGLPPLAEQHRIVAKVDELMALCDQLEAAQAERERSRDRLVAASLHRLNTTTDSDAFRAAARFHLSHLSRMTVNPEQVQQLRKTILRFAYLGKLTGEDADRKGVEALIEALENEHYRQWESAQITRFTRKGAKPKNEKWKARFEPCPGVDDDDLPQIPKTWKWVTLEFVCPLIVDSAHRTPHYSPTGQFFALRPRDVSNGVLNLAGAARVDDEEFKIQTLRLEPAAGDVVYSRELSYGWAIALPEGIKVCLSQGMVAMRPYHDVLVEFLVGLLNSPVVRDQAEEAALGAAHPHVNLQDIRAFKVPLPPLVEQRRIVAKVAELMALCDEVDEERLATKLTKRRLTEAILHDLLA